MSKGLASVSDAVFMRDPQKYNGGERFEGELMKFANFINLTHRT